MKSFLVSVYNIHTGEKWTVSLDAVDKTAALTRVLRRKRFVEFFLESGDVWTSPFQFQVLEV